MRDQWKAAPLNRQSAEQFLTRVTLKRSSDEDCEPYRLPLRELQGLDVPADVLGSQVRPQRARSVKRRKCCMPIRHLGGSLQVPFTILRKSCDHPIPRVAPVVLDGQEGEIGDSFAQCRGGSTNSLSVFSMACRTIRVVHLLAGIRRERRDLPMNQSDL